MAADNNTSQYLDKHCQLCIYIKSVHLTTYTSDTEYRAHGFNYRRPITIKTTKPAALGKLKMTWSKFV